MHKIGFFEKIFYSAAHKLILGLFTLSFILLTSSPISELENSQLSINAPAFSVDFSDFSPAFAALEDEFLFSETTTLQITSGQKPFHVEENVANNSSKNFQVVAAHDLAPTRIFDSLSFDGSQALNEKTLKKLIPLTKSYNVRSATENSHQELGSGSLAALVGHSFSKENSIVKSATPTSQTPKTIPETAPIPNDELTTNSDESDASLDYETVTVSGNVSLNEGLAYFGDMDVAWIVGDQEYSRGSINAKDATFSIDVKDNIGDIVISLYDNKNELIGEGFIDLTQVKIIDSSVIADISIYPINWDTAGRVVDASSLGFQNFDGIYKQKTLKNVLIELYAFSEATETDVSGEFSFYNWKKSNSRSLAIASKKGYKDSLFLLDSKKEASVLLFSNEYLNSFFSYLNDLGVRDVSRKGTIYGNILGSEASGYSVTLEKQKPIYFLQSGFANIFQKATSSNGQFAFVGLNDGEYELTVEKAGQIVDRKIILVEQNKISPVVIDLKAVSKHLEFFNPLNPKEKINSLKTSFFDGESEVKLNNNNSTFMSINNSSQPSLFDFKGPHSTEISRTFISQNKGLQRIPLLQDDTLLKLAETNDMKLNHGVIIGFIDSPHAYRVTMKESLPEKIIYFDEQGQELLESSKIPYGFIMGGFNKGLSSIIVLRNSDDMILMTDLVFSDHDSVSIMNSSISSVDN